MTIEVLKPLGKRFDGEDTPIAGQIGFTFLETLCELALDRNTEQAEALSESICSHAKLADAVIATAVAAICFQEKALREANRIKAAMRESDPETYAKIQAAASVEGE